MAASPLARSLQKQLRRGSGGDWLAGVKPAFSLSMCCVVLLGCGQSNDSKRAPVGDAFEHPAYITYRPEHVRQMSPFSAKCETAQTMRMTDSGTNREILALIFLKKSDGS